jgi:hypothetical protein
MVEMTSITGTYDVFTASTSAGPWHLETSGTVPGCQSGSGFCHALVGHPELSTSSQLVITYFNPNAGPRGASGPIGHLVGVGTSYGDPPPGAPVVASPQYGVANQTDHFSVDNTGTIRVSTQSGSGGWEGPVAITAPGFAAPGAHVAVSQQFGIANQTDVFVVDQAGRLQVVWVDGAGVWQGPLAITPANTAPSGAAVVASNQFGIANQTDVFVVGSSGATEVSWVDGAGAWQGPLGIAAAGTAPAGAGLAASQQFGIANQTDVFVVGGNGATQVSWVDGAGTWQGPMGIAAAGTAPAGAGLAASQQFGAGNQTDVFVVGSTGATDVSTVVGAGAWQGANGITPAGTAPAGAPLAASQQFGVANQTDVFVVDDNGAVQVSTVVGAGAWQGPTGISPAGAAPASAWLGASQVVSTPNQTDAFFIAPNGTTQVLSAQGSGAWQGPNQIS